MRSVYWRAAAVWHFGADGQLWPQLAAALGGLKPHVDVLSNPAPEWSLAGTLNMRRADGIE